VFDNLPIDATIFADTSFIEDLVFGAHAGLCAGPNIKSWLSHKRYRTVFFLDPLESYEQGTVRLESQQMARRIGEQVRAAYIAHGYQPVVVPEAPVADRVALILSTIRDG
jgi:predicted ATPase